MVRSDERMNHRLLLFLAISGILKLAMILSIDFGGAVAKVLVIRGEKFNVVEVPLGFRTRPRLTISDALRHVINQAVGDEKPDAVYASGEIASVELKELLTEPALDPIETLEKLELPAVVVGAGITYVNGRARRGDNLALKPEEIVRWLPFEIKLSEIQNFFANKEIYPQLIPITERDIRLEEAAARVRIRSIFDTFNSDYVIASGGVLSHAPNPSHVVLILLDSLEPQGLLKIYLDTKQILPALATLAVYEEEAPEAPSIAQKILNQEPLAFLGTTFSVCEPVSLKIDVGLTQMQELELDLGELAVFPLDEGKTARVHFETKSQKGDFEADGGPCGLVIDARGRPLQVPQTTGERQRVLIDWEEHICFAPLFKK